MEIDKPFNAEEAMDRLQEILVNVTSSSELSDVVKTLTTNSNMKS
jgi:hypothetical protein